MTAPGGHDAGSIAHPHTSKRGVEWTGPHLPPGRAGRPCYPAVITRPYPIYPTVPCAAGYDPMIFA